MNSKKVVVVTGAGRGLGRALSIELAGAGYRVYGLGRDSESLAETSSKISDDGFVALVADVADPVSISGAFGEIVDAAQRIDILFNNAAVYPKVSFLAESADEFNSAIAINVMGVSNCCKAALPFMISQGWGRIYNVGSWADRAPIRDSAAYSASKGAIHALTKAISMDLEPLSLDIEVHEWIPGHLNTRMSDFTGIDPHISAGWALQMVERDAASTKSSVFENDRECAEKPGLRRRLISKLAKLSVKASS